MHDAVTMARGLLLALGPLLERMEATPAKDEAKRAEFLAHVDRVRRIARREELPVDHHRGVAYILRDSAEHKEHIRAVRDAAKISAAELDRACAAVVAGESAALAEGEAKVIELSRTPIANADAVPGLLSALAAVDAAKAELHEAIAAKSKALAEAWPEGTGREEEYLEQADGLDKSLCLGPRRALAAAHASLIDRALEVCPSQRLWPPAPGGRPHDRARALALQIRDHRG